jgi:hypothetical protein
MSELNNAVTHSVTRIPQNAYTWLTCVVRLRVSSLSQSEQVEDGCPKHPTGALNATLHRLPYFHEAKTLWGDVLNDQAQRYTAAETVIHSYHPRDIGSQIREVFLDM